MPILLYTDLRPYVAVRQSTVHCYRLLIALQTWSWCACTMSRTWMAYRSCGWIRWISTYLFIQLPKPWQWSMLLKLQILHPHSLARTYWLDVTQWAIPTEEGKSVPTKLLLITWQTFCPCADTATLIKAWIFRKMLWQQLGNTWCHYTREVTLVVIWMHCELISLVTSKETCVAFHLPKMPSSCTFVEPCTSWPYASEHICFRQSTLLLLTLAESLSMISWWQPWCWRKQNQQYSNAPNTVAARKACVSEDAPVQEPMWGVSSHVSALGIATNVQGLNSHLKTVTVTELNIRFKKDLAPLTCSSGWYLDNVSVLFYWTNTACICFQCLFWN